MNISSGAFPFWSHVNCHLFLFKLLGILFRTFVLFVYWQPKEQAFIISAAEWRFFAQGQGLAKNQQGVRKGSSTNHFYR